MGGSARHQALHPDIVAIGGIIGSAVRHRPATELTLGNPFVVQQNDVVMTVVVQNSCERRFHAPRRSFEHLQEMHAVRPEQNR